MVLQPWTSNNLKYMYGLIWHMYKMKFQSLLHGFLYLFHLFVTEITRNLKQYFIKYSRIIRLGINMKARLWRTGLMLSSWDCLIKMEKLCYQSCWLPMTKRIINRTAEWRSTILRSWNIQIKFTKDKV